jgi:hypothetical protein
MNSRNGRPKREKSRNANSPPNDSTAFHSKKPKSMKLAEIMLRKLRGVAKPQHGWSVYRDIVGHAVVGMAGGRDKYRQNGQIALETTPTSPPNAASIWLFSAVLVKFDGE